MCGIFAACSTNLSSDAELFDIYESCRDNLQRRGPDSFRQELYRHSDYNLLFAAGVLWLQGDDIVHQPVTTDKSALVYNGDVFASSIISDEDRLTIGDTKLLLKHLDDAACVMNVLSRLQGPYSFVYLNKETSKLYFGRDVFGRRSLLIGKKGNGLFLTSVASELPCVELPAVGVFSLDLKSQEISVSPWQFHNKNFTTKLSELKSFLNEDVRHFRELPLVDDKLFVEPTFTDLSAFQEITNSNVESALQRLLCCPRRSANVAKLNGLLEEAVRRRISTQPKFCQTCVAQKRACNHALVGVLFSGGLDCTILALLADKFCDVGRPIDLINVAFEKRSNYDTPDRMTGVTSFEELKSLRPGRTWNFVEVNVTEDELNLERSRRIRHLISPLNTVLDDSLGCALWFASRGENCEYKSPCRVCI